MAAAGLKRSLFLGAVMRSLSLVAVVMLLSVCLAASPATPQVDCELTVGKGPFITGEPVQVGIALANHSGSAITAFRPEVRNEDAARLVIVGPDGTILKYTGETVCGIGPRPVSLADGMSLAAEVDIRDYYNILKVGKYTAYAVCRLANPETEIRSNEIVFEVVKRNGKFLREVTVERFHLDGSNAGHISWRIFTHRRGDTAELYAQRFRETKIPFPFAFVKLGAVAAEDKISCRVDSEGQLHVLYAVPVLANTYAYDTVSIFGDLRRDGLYKAAEKDTVPLLATKVYLKNGQVVKARDRPQD